MVRAEPDYAWPTLLCFGNTGFGNFIFQTGADTLQTLCFANSYVTMRSSQVRRPTVVLVIGE